MLNLASICGYMAALLFAGSLGIAAVVDGRDGIIPDRCHMGLLASGALLLYSGGLLLWDALAGLLLLGGFILAFSLWRDHMGGGDVKLIGAASFACGLYAGLHAVAVSFSAAVVYVLIRKRLRPEKGEAVRLGPFLAAGFGLVYFCEVFKI